MTNKINAGFIGVGAFTDRMHLPHTLANPKYRIHTLCDLNKDLLKEREKQYKPIKTTTDYHDILKDPEIDMVFIGSRHDKHAFFIEECAKVGKNVMVEKPMATTNEESRKIIDCVDKSNIRLMVGYNRRFSQAMIDAKKIFQENKSTATNVYYRMADENKDMDYYGFDVDKFGGHLVTEVCHIFDLLSWFLEEEPREIYAAGDLKSNQNVTITFIKGSVATIINSTRGTLNYPKEYMEVFSGYTTLAIDWFSEIRFSKDGEYRRINYPMKRDEIPEIVCESPNMTSEDIYRKYEFIAKNNLYWKRKFQPDKGHYAELDVYADALLNDKPSPVDERDGARATAMAQAANESIKKKAVQSIETFWI
ncbi:MAG: Gfo/Idh/MocA family oxidoreductase [bacterium]|nr:Gfo/Idh/MocA family oxidoreductase [bacterium]